MKLSDARIIINYLKIQTDSLAVEVEERIPIDSSGAPDPLVVEKLAKISCKLANHKLAVEMLEEYYELSKDSQPADGFNTPEVKEVQRHSLEKNPASALDSDKVITKSLSRPSIPPSPEEKSMLNVPEEDTLFDPWRDSND
jgi:hypothetical protein